MQTSSCFSADVLKIDAAAEIGLIHEAIRDIVFQQLGRKGAVVGLSGGIDSSVTAALCTGALGRERVFGLMMPERDSSGDSLELGRLIAEHCGIDNATEDLTPTLTALGCYERRDEAIRRVIPEYTSAWKSKIVLPSVLNGDSYSIFSVVAISPEGKQVRARMTAEAYLGVVAATNFKQRVRKMLEYYHCDRLQYAVAGTPNRLEYDQGFFVKLGDGAADFKPIAHLYKSQVYQIAEYLQIPHKIRRRPPTTDTYSLEQSQEEFYFSLPLAQMDLCLYGKNHNVPAEEVASALGLETEQVSRVYRQIDAKRKMARYLHCRPLLVHDVVETDDSTLSR